MGFVIAVLCLVCGGMVGEKLWPQDEQLTKAQSITRGMAVYIIVVFFWVSMTALAGGYREIVAPVVGIMCFILGFGFRGSGIRFWKLW